MTTSRLALYRALRTGRVDALDVGLLAPASRDILQMYGRLRAGFDSVRRERDELRRRALKESPPAASDTEAAEPSGPPESGADATGVTDLTDVTIHFRNMNTLNLYCLGDNPVLEHLVQALARAGETGSDQEMFYLEADGKTFYFPVSQLLAVEANGEILSATDAPTSAARTRPGSGHQAVSGFHSISPRKSVAVLVLGCLLPEYEVCLDVIQRTWATERFADIDVYYAFGGHFDRMAVSATSIEKYIGDGAPALRAFQTRLAGNVITCGCADTIHLQTDSLLRKRLIAFSHFARERRYDFVYSVCASSYVDQARLREYVESVDGKLLLHGPVGVCEFTGRPYVSGASTLLSIDMIDRLVGNAYRILEQNHGRYADDVALGSWIARHVSDTSETRIVQNIRAGRRATGDNTFVAPGARSMIDYVGVDPVSQIPVAGAYHYHFKTDTIGQMMDFHRQFFE